MELKSVKRLFIFVFLLAVAQLSAQVTCQDRNCQGTLAAAAQTVTIFPPEDLSTLGIVIRGTWSQTLQFEGSGDNGATWNPIACFPPSSNTIFTSTTINGTFIAGISGFTAARVRSSGFTSGTAVINLVASK
jgi:hypothetical protein